MSTRHVPETGLDAGGTQGIGTVNSCGIDNLVQGSENFFCKGQNRKYFRL